MHHGLIWLANVPGMDFATMDTFLSFQKTKVIWHVIQFGASSGPALFKQGYTKASLSRVIPNSLHVQICIGKYFNWFKSSSMTVPKASILVLPPRKYPHLIKSNMFQHICSSLFVVILVFFFAGQAKRFSSRPCLI